MNFSRVISVGSIFLLWFAGLAAAAQYAKISITLTNLAVAYPDAPINVTFVFSVIGIVAIVFGLTAGVVVGRMGFRRILIFALILGAAMSALQASLPPFSVLMASRVFEGISHLCIVVAAPTLMIQLSPRKYHAVVMGLWASFFSVSYGLTGWLGFVFLETVGLGTIYAVHALIMTVITGLVIFFLPLDVVSNSSSENDKKTPFWRLWLDAHRETYSRLSISAPGIIFLWQTIMYVALLTFIPEFAAPEYRALMFATMPLAGTVGTLLAGFLAQRFSAVLPGIIGFIGVSAIAIFMYYELGGGFFYTVLAIVLMSVSGLVQGAVFALVPALNEGSITQAWSNGSVAQMGNLGTALGTPIFAMFISLGGFRAIVGTVLGLALAGSISLVIVGAYQRQTKTL